MSKESNRENYYRIMREWLSGAKLNLAEAARLADLIGE